MGNPGCYRPDRIWATLALELIGRGIWKEAGVYAPEYFDPKPYLELMKESGYKYGIIEK